MDLRKLEQNLTRELEQKKRIGLFLDYDGTLVTYHDRSEQALLSPREINLLSKLSQLGVILVVVSARPHTFLQSIFKDTGVYIASELGMCFQEPGSEPIFPCKLDNSWIENLASRMVGFISSGIEFEAKLGSVAIHFRNVVYDEEKKLTCFLTDFCIKNNLKCAVGSRGIDIYSENWDKGHFLVWFLSKIYFCELPLAIGDTTSDSEMFRMANCNGGFGVSIGKEKIDEAKYSLHSPYNLWLFIELFTDYLCAYKSQNIQNPPLT